LLAKTTKDSISISWEESTATEIPVSGYHLYMSSNVTGNFVLIYNGSLNALQREFEARELETGSLYQFRVAAVNFNGLSPQSASLSVHACVAPDPPPSIRRVTGDRTSITLAWEAPPDDGGCPITGYQLMRDSGGGLGDPIAVEVDAAAINNRPTLREHSVQLTSAETGLPIRFQLVAHNAEGSATSAIFEFLLAGAPDKPPGLVSKRYAEPPYLVLT